MIVEIEGIKYQTIDRKDYSKYVEECKLNSIKVTFKSHKVDGKSIVVYPCIIKNPVEEKTGLPIEVPKKSLSFLSLSGEKLEIIEKPKQEKTQYDNTIQVGDKPNLFQYCDRCKEETVHYHIRNIILCQVCKNGYEVFK